MTQPAGRGATVDFRFRNAKHVDFVAQEIDVRKLLDDVKAYLKSKPKQLDWQQLNISDIGYRLVQDRQGKYVGAEIAHWKLDLEPREKHFDKRITVTTPLQTPGAYLVTAKLADGNTSKIILWLADTAIVRKPMEDKSFYYRRRRRDRRADTPKRTLNSSATGNGKSTPTTSRSTPRTSPNRPMPNGQVCLPIPDDAKDPQARDYQWIAIATTAKGRLAYLGFHNVWRATLLRSPVQPSQNFYDHRSPGLSAGSNGAVQVLDRHKRNTTPTTSRHFAHQSFAVEIQNPKGEKIYSETLTSDNYGGIAGKFELPADATLGQSTSCSSSTTAAASFRVEEYKKPEYEVTVDAPTEPVMLGEKITATIRAKYYFGSPVTNATVKYKVLRTEHTSRWFPPGPWDWLYGPGYWWFAYDYAWYPGWRDWGCFAAGAVVVLASPRSARNRRRARSADRPRRHGQSRDRYVARQRAAPRSGPPLRDSSRSRRRIAAHDRRQRRGARRPQAVPGVRLGRSRLLPCRRHDRRQLRRTADRWQAGRRHRQTPAAENYRTDRRRNARPSKPKFARGSLATNAEGRSRDPIEGVRKGPVSGCRIA